MSIDDAIKRLSSCHPITEEDKKVFECAIHCMKFTRDFFPLNATPERMEKAIQLLNSLEYAMKNANRSGGRVYFTSNPDGLKEFKVDANRIAEAKEKISRYEKR